MPSTEETWMTREGFWNERCEAEALRRFVFAARRVGAAREGSRLKSIHIGNVTVPIVDYAVGASAVLGIRDSGKTVTSKGIAEQLLDNGVPIIVFDAVGKWRWMKV